MIWYLVLVVVLVVAFVANMQLAGRRTKRVHRKRADAAPRKVKSRPRRKKRRRS